jgi:hypothetical protein
MVEVIAAAWLDGGIVTLPLAGLALLQRRKMDVEIARGFRTVCAA